MYTMPNADIWPTTNYRDNYGSRFTDLLFTLCHRQIYNDHRRADCKDSSMWTQKMQLILIGKLD